VVSADDEQSDGWYLHADEQGEGEWAKKFRRLEADYGKPSKNRA